MITAASRIGNSPRGMRSEISRISPGRFWPSSAFVQAVRILRSTDMAISNKPHATATSHGNSPAPESRSVLCAVNRKRHHQDSTSRIAFGEQPRPSIGRNDSAGH